MKIYRFSEVLDFDSPVHAVAKGMEDIEFVLNRFPLDSFNDIGISYLDVQGKNKIQKFLYYINYRRQSVLKDLYFSKGKTVFFHYPFAKGRIFDSVIVNRFMDRNRVCLLVHDIDALRKQNIDSNEGQQAIRQEVNILNKAYAIMLHNPCMEQKLRDNGLTVRNLTNVGIFDYLIDKDKVHAVNSRSFAKSIVYAGNLSKSEFIKRLGELQNYNLMFELYGPFFDKKLEKLSYVNYHGNLDANEIVFKLNGSFGLIWDGPEITTCSGAYGNYLRYNNPFKASLYIAAQLPLIVWSKSAVADFVKEHGIGITIDSLEDIDKRIASMSESEYGKMYRNIINLSFKVRSGGFLYEAIKGTLKMCEE